jgi:uncharacterized membrane protein
MFAPSIEVQNMHYGHLLALAAAAIPAAADGGPIHRFALPHNQYTCGFGIARDHTIVGGTPIITNGGGQSSVQPFVYDKGAFTNPQPDVPIGTVTFTGINASHEILVTDYVNTGNLMTVTQSFTYANGVTTPLTWQGAMNILARSINDAGTIVGSFQSQTNGPALGFINRGGHIDSFQFNNGDTTVTAIDHNGRITVGISLTPGSNFAAWIRQNGAFTPIAVPGALATFAYGVTSTGRVAGTYVTGTTQDTAHGFLWQNGVFTTFDVPGATSTEIAGMNEAGVVTGCTTDAHGTYKGFFTKP